MTRPARLRALVAAVASALMLSGCSVYDAPLPGGPDTGENPIEVTARFRDVLDLVPQSTVKLDDVNVGKVTAVKLDGYVAEVTMSLSRGADLPENVAAQIRQTSLLGEKFVSLEKPEEPSSSALADGAVIGLDRTGRNPEIEEVFSALALLLNGGGVGQLKSISQELNLALDGRSQDVKSVLRQISTFMGTLDDNRAAIIAAIENTNRLAKQARAQQGTIEAALDDVPGALRSLERQRADLVRMLEALTRLSDVGTRVIRASKESTINSLRDLGPVLRGFADAGQNLPKSLQVYLTYPFVDEAVGRDPQVARNLHMGDYTNLSVELDLDIANLPLQEIVCGEIETLREEATAAVDQAFESDPITPVLSQLTDLLGAGPAEDVRDQLRAEVLERVLDAVEKTCEAVPLARVQEILGALLARILANDTALPTDEIVDLLDGVVRGLTSRSPLLGDGSAADDALGGLLSGGSGGGSGGGSSSGGGSGSSGGSGSGGGLGGAIGGLVPRTAPTYDDKQIDPFGLAERGLDPGVGTLLLQGVATNR